jgi:dihydrofolate reductase
MLSIIAAIGKNRELGRDNKLLWHVPGDLPRFKKLTSGHPVIMGRKTFESIGRPLPDRTNIVISSHSDIASFSIALEKAKTSPGSEEIFIIGGGSVYAQAIDIADRLYLTVVDKEAPDADTYFPEYMNRFTKIIEKSSKEENGIRYTFYTLEPKE